MSGRSSDEGESDGGRRAAGGSSLTPFRSTILKKKGGEGEEGGERSVWLLAASPCFVLSQHILELEYM
jgi:hypothetical protein